MLSLPEYVTMQCPRCSDDIVLQLGVETLPGSGGRTLMLDVTDFEGPVEQHYRDAGHVDAEDNVWVRVHELHLN